MIWCEELAAGGERIFAKSDAGQPALLGRCPVLWTPWDI
jgi:hypothetical protein